MGKCLVCLKNKKKTFFTAFLKSELPSHVQVPNYTLSIILLQIVIYCLNTCETIKNYSCLQRKRFIVAYFYN